MPVTFGISAETSAQRSLPPVRGIQRGDLLSSKLPSLTSRVTGSLGVPTRAVNLAALFPEIDISYFDIASVPVGSHKYPHLSFCDDLNPWSRRWFRLGSVRTDSMLPTFPDPFGHVQLRMDPSGLNLSSSTATERVNPPPPGRAPL